MATKDWLDKHAKVTAYLDFSLYASLENWMKKNKIKKASQALTIILEHYLEGNIPTEILPDTLEQEVTEAKEGLTKTELCDKLNTSVSTINEWAAMLNLDPDDYLYERTGWKKPPNARRYFPTSSQSS